MATIYPTTIVFGDTTDGISAVGSNFLESNGGALYFNGDRVNTGSNSIDVISTSLLVPKNGSNVTFASNLVFRASPVQPAIGGGFQFWSFDQQLYFEGQPVGGRSNIIDVLSANIIQTRAPNNELFVDANINCNGYFIANTAGMLTTSNLIFRNADPNITYSGGSLSIQPTGSGGIVKFYGATNQSNIWLVSTDPTNQVGTDVSTFSFVATGDTGSVSNTHCIGKIRVSQTETLSATGVGGGGSLMFSTRDPSRSAFGNQGDADVQIPMLVCNTSTTGNTLTLGPNPSDGIFVGVGTATPTYPFQVGSQLYVDTTNNRTIVTTLGFQGDMTMLPVGASSRVQIGSSGAGSQAVAVGVASSGAGSGAVAVGYGAGAGGDFATALGYQAGSTDQGSQSVAIGYQAGQTSQGSQAVSLGYQAGQTSQGVSALAIGLGAGQTSQGSSAVAIGNQAGQTSQGSFAFAIGPQSGLLSQRPFSFALGYQAGSTSQGSQSAAIGYQAGSTGQGSQSTALGYQAGQTSQGVSTLALGYQAGQTSQGSGALAIGSGAGQTVQGSGALAIGASSGLTSQGFNAIAIGAGAGNLVQNAQSVAIGSQAGESAQHSYAIAIGTKAGQFWQGSQAVAVGNEAGLSSQGDDAFAFGTLAGQYAQGVQSIAIGTTAGQTSQGSQSMALGYQAGKTSQGSQAMALGVEAGKTGQGSQSMALGFQAGSTGQGSQAVAIGPLAGQAGQGAGAIAIGYKAGGLNQLVGTTAIGYQAGLAGQGSFSLALGYNAAAFSLLPNYTILLNATGTDKLVQTPSTFNVFPVRNAAQASNQGLSYNSVTGEIYASPALTTNFSNVGVSNTSPFNTFVVGSSLFVTDGASTTMRATGNISANAFLGSALYLSNVAGATAAATYGSGTSVPSITVDSQGRITTISATAATPTGNLQQIATIGNVTTLNIVTGGLVTTGNVNIGNTVSSNALLNIGTSTFFRDAANTVVTRGNVVANYFYGSAKLLANVFPQSGVFGSSSQVPVITIDLEGKVQSVGTIGVTGSQTLENVLDIGNSATTMAKFTNAYAAFTTTTSVGIANVAPTRTLCVGANTWVNDTGPVVLNVIGNVSVGTVWGQILGANTVNASTISGATFYGSLAGSNTVNASTISGATLYGQISALANNVSGANLFGNILGSNTVNASTISGTTFYGSLAGSNTIAASTISGVTLYGSLAGSNTVAASTISGVTLYGSLAGSNTVAASTISGTTLIGQISALSNGISGMNLFGNVIGSNTGSFSNVYLSSNIIGLGPGAGASSAANTVSIGAGAGGVNQSSYSVAIGDFAGASDQLQLSVAVGSAAGSSGQQASAVAVGVNAGTTSQQGYAVSIGSGAGYTSQQASAVAVGVNAGGTTQQASAIAIGNGAGSLGQNTYAVAIGLYAGTTSQQTSAIAIGNEAGSAGQNAYSIAMGYQAGQTGQNPRAIALGQQAGQTTHGSSAIAIGYVAGQTLQGESAVAIGFNAGRNSQNAYSVSLGYGAGQNRQGSYSVAIGSLAGQTNQNAYSIALNATGVAFNPANLGTFIKPVRYTGTVASNVTTYNSSTGEITATPWLMTTVGDLSLAGNWLFGNIAGQNTISGSTLTLTGGINDGSSTGTAYKVLTASSAGGNLSWLSCAGVLIESGNFSFSGSAGTFFRWILSTTAFSSTAFSSYRIRLSLTTSVSLNDLQLYFFFATSGSVVNSSNWYQYVSWTPYNGNGGGTFSNAVIATYNRSYDPICYDIYVNNPNTADMKTVSGQYVCRDSVAIYNTSVSHVFTAATAYPGFGIGSTSGGISGTWAVYSWG